MQICMIAAGFTRRRGRPAAARDGGLEAQGRRGQVRAPHRRRHGRARLRRRSSPRRIFKQIQRLRRLRLPGEPRLSFALLAYVERWLKCHDPADFLAALLNSQPMGFYAPSQLVQDARRHGVEVRPVDVTAQRLGLHAGAPRARAAPADAERAARGAAGPAPGAVGFAQAAAERLVQGPRASAPSPTSKTWPAAPASTPHELQALAARRRAVQRWPATAGSRPGPPPARSRRRALLADAPVRRSRRSPCPRPPEGEAIVFDYAALGLTLAPPPAGAAARRAWRAAAGAAPTELARLPDGALGLGLRHRHHAPAARHRQRHHLRHAGGRDRLGQRHRLAPRARGAAPGAAGARGCWRWPASGRRATACRTWSPAGWWT